MPSNRNIKERQRAQREAMLAATLSNHRKRSKADTGRRLLLDHLPRAHRGVAAIRGAADRLCLALRRSKLLDPGRRYRPADLPDSYTLAHGLVQLLLRQARWIRPPGAWSTRSHNADRQFASLARHLLCRYDVPSCMDAAWFDGREERADRFQRWFEHLGRGGNLRKAPGLPCTLTRRAAHLFMTSAPADLSILRALRWSQLRALGVDRRLLAALLDSGMAVDFAHDDFWMTLVRFFMNHPLLDRRHVEPIVDFIDDRRHQPSLDGAPDQPNFSMKGRSPTTLLRQVDEWHHDIHSVGVSRPASSVRWESCGIEGMRRVEGDGPKAVLYRVSELLSSGELWAEGREMHHCVATYAGSCLGGYTAIFKLTREDRVKLRARLTIEVQPSTRQIVEARGRCNAEPTADQLRVMRAWAREAGLTLNPFL